MENEKKVSDKERACPQKSAVVAVETLKKNVASYPIQRYKFTEQCKAIKMFYAGNRNLRFFILKPSLWHQNRG